MVDSGYGTCQVCDREPAVGVLSVPYVPISMAYGRKCLDANAHPWWILVSNTAEIGGLDDADRGWRQMVTDTCAHLGKTVEEFNAEVAQAIADDPYNPANLRCDVCGIGPEGLNYIGHEVYCKAHFDERYESSSDGTCFVEKPRETT